MVMTEHLGLKIKELREAAKMSSEELASKANIHPSQLQAVENAELVPSMPTLMGLTRALNVRLGTILDGTEHNGPVVASADAQPEVMSMSNTNTSARKHLNFFSLAQEKPDRNMDPLMVSVGYVAPAPDTLSHHEGEEFLYVLSGEVELRYGSETYPLSAGQSIYYDSLVPHCLSTRSENAPAAKVLAVTYIPY